jgi:Cu/Ag efflux protein CusF
MKSTLLRFATPGLISVTLLLSACSSRSKPQASDRDGYSPEGTTTVAYTEGVPGGVIVDTVTMTATVAAVDPATRMVTLVEPDGTRSTVEAGPDVINFDQIRVGDRLKATVEAEFVVFMKTAGAPSNDGRLTAIAGAAKGAKPGGAIADSVETTASVKSIDLKRHRATLQFPDGKTLTVPVRPDVDLTKVSRGDEVVIRVTDAVAVVVEQP